MAACGAAVTDAGELNPAGDLVFCPHLESVPELLRGGGAQVECVGRGLQLAFLALALKDQHLDKNEMGSGKRRPLRPCPHLSLTPKATLWEARVCRYPRQAPAQTSDPCPGPGAVPQLTCPTCDHLAVVCGHREREGSERGNGETKVRSLNPPLLCSLP